MNRLHQSVQYMNPFISMHSQIPRLIDWTLGSALQIHQQLCPLVNGSSLLNPRSFLTSLFVVVPQDRAYEIVEDMEANKVRKMKKRICLVLDCLCAHDFSDKTADLINLQHYVIKEKRLSEREAIVIFYDVVRVVEALHKVSQGLFMHQDYANPASYGCVVLHFHQ